MFQVLSIKYFINMNSITSLFNHQSIYFGILLPYSLYLCAMNVCPGQIMPFKSHQIHEIDVSTIDYIYTLDSLSFPFPCLFILNK